MTPGTDLGFLCLFRWHSNCIWMCNVCSPISHGLSPDDNDRPPVANGGQDRVVQPQDTVTLNGIESKDDNGIESYQWQMLTSYQYAVIQVSVETAMQN